ncbi:MAG: sarcosine oxidase subunit gamma family protein [Sneathiella sp.]
MVKSEFWQSPLAALFDRFPAGLDEVYAASQINLRGNPEDPKFLEDVEKILGFALPLTPNTTATNGVSKILWLGPDEWLIVLVKAAEDIVQKLNGLSDAHHVSVVDVGANRVVVELKGPHCIDVLMKSCEMDFHASVSGPGQVVQTLLAKSQAIIERVEEEHFHIYIRNSFAHYVVEWLIDAYQEFES